jgi:hypothetical protein
LAARSETGLCSVNARPLLANAPKWFAAVELIRLAADKDWLNKATKEIFKHWRHKRERRINSIEQDEHPQARLLKIEN